MVVASWTEDHIQRSFYLVPFRAKNPSPLQGTPEAVGKADYLESVIRDVTAMLGITSGLAQVLDRVFNHRGRRLEAIHLVSRQP